MLRAGLSGCGAAGIAAVAAVRGRGECDIVAAHDPDPAALAALQRTAPVGATSTRFEDLLATGVDFVVLTGPCGLRPELVRLAAEQAVPVLLHAPMAPTLAIAESMVAACAAAEVRLGVLVPAMADPVFEQIRRMVVDGWFGGLCAVHAFSGDDDLLRRPPTADDPRLRAHWFGGDPLVRLAVPGVHLTAWLTGRRCLRTTAQASHGLLPLPHDGAVATTVLRGGALAVHAASHLTHGRTFELRGTGGSVQVTAAGLLAQGERRYDGASFCYDTPGRAQAFARDALAGELARLAPALELHRQFARWLDDVDGFPCPAEQALEDMRVLDAMQRALVSGRIEPV